MSAGGEVAACPSCGKATDGGSRFCSHCGQALADAAKIEALERRVAEIEGQKPGLQVIQRVERGDAPAPVIGNTGNDVADDLNNFGTGLMRLGCGLLLVLPFVAVLAGMCFG